MRYLTILITSAVLSLFIIGSCNERQLDRTDQIVADANSLVTIGGAILESPGARVIPPDWRLYGSLAVLLGSALTNGYQKWRGSQMTKTTKAIVKGIEKAEKAAQGNPIAPVKMAIAKEMRAARVFDVGNKIVARLKIS